MNKEKVSYIKHIMSSDFVQLDFLNVCLSLGVIVVSLLSFVSGNLMSFIGAFTLGATLALFNMIKSIMRKSAMGVVVFGAVLLALAAIIYCIYNYLYI